ncbi:uncharacterized protein EHS24_003193 [Apiotrichum porosum]|uniref:Thioredoxin domain-containing protein n=1 Tax=Apiotrichum porosum TaxID=105984 RepID=A0A427XFW2_9TREE|nr:uncharacterized protein EHS24_003193 [Apiotrichum porosum]RSH77633.1 hypothetical protein EHS24_003193 [Apiotrichum porosum]
MSIYSAGRNPTFGDGFGIPVAVSPVPSTSPSLPPPSISRSLSLKLALVQKEAGSSDGGQRDKRGSSKRVSYAPSLAPSLAGTFGGRECEQTPASPSITLDQFDDDHDGQTTPSVHPRSGVLLALDSKLGALSTDDIVYSGAPEIPQVTGLDCDHGTMGILWPATGQDDYHPAPHQDSHNAFFFPVHVNAQAIPDGGPRTPDFTASTEALHAERWSPASTGTATLATPDTPTIPTLLDAVAPPRSSLLFHVQPHYLDIPCGDHGSDTATDEDVATSDTITAAASANGRQVEAPLSAGQPRSNAMLASAIDELATDVAPVNIISPRELNEARHASPDDDLEGDQHCVAAWDEDMPRSNTPRVSRSGSVPLDVVRPASQPHTLELDRGVVIAAPIPVPAAVGIYRGSVEELQATSSTVSSAAASDASNQAPVAVSRVTPAPSTSAEQLSDQAPPTPPKTGLYAGKYGTRPAPPPPTVAPYVLPQGADMRLRESRLQHSFGHGVGSSRRSFSSLTSTPHHLVDASGSRALRSAVLPNHTARSSTFALSLSKDQQDGSTTPSLATSQRQRKLSNMFGLRKKQQQQPPADLPHSETYDRLGLFEDENYKPQRKTLLFPPEPEEDETFSVWRVPSQRRLWEAGLCFVHDDKGNAVCFGDLFPRWPEDVHVPEREGPEPRTVVFFIRHWWCGTCQDYTMESLSRLDSSLLAKNNVRVVVVGSGNWKIIAAYRHVLNCDHLEFYTDTVGKLWGLMGMTKSMPYKREKDRPMPEYNVHSLPKQIYKGMKNAFTQFPIAHPGDYTRLGGEFILAPNYTCDFAHRMTHSANHMEAVDVVRRAGVDHPATSLPSAPDAAALAAREELNRITREVHEWELARELELERMRRKRAARRGGSMALSKLSEYDTAHGDRDSDSGSDTETEAGTTGGRRPPELVATNPGDSISSSDGMSSEYCANDLEELHHPIVVRGAHRPFHEEGMVKEGKHDDAGVYAGSHIGVL